MFFSEISFFGLTYPFLGGGGGGGKPEHLKKIYRPRVIFNIPGPPWADATEMMVDAMMSVLSRYNPSRM